MTDKERLRDLLTAFGVEFSEDVDSITCWEGTKKVEGYPCFYTAFQFDRSGKFECMGAYE